MENMENKLAYLVIDTLEQEGIILHAMMRNKIFTDHMISLLDVDGYYLIFTLEVSDTDNVVKMRIEFPFKCQTAATYLVNQYIIGFSFRNPCPLTSLEFDQNTGRMFTKCQIRVGVANYESELVVDALNELLAVAKYVHNDLKELARGIIRDEDKAFYIASLSVALTILKEGKKEENTYGLNSLDLKIYEQDIEEASGLIERSESGDKHRK